MGLALALVPARADTLPVVDWQVHTPEAKPAGRAISFLEAVYARDAGGRLKFVLSCMDPAHPEPGPVRRNVRLSIVSLDGGFYLHKEDKSKIWSYFITTFGDNPPVSHVQSVIRYTNA